MQICNDLLLYCVTSFEGYSYRGHEGECTMQKPTRVSKVLPAFYPRIVVLVTVVLCVIQSSCLLGPVETLTILYRLQYTCANGAVRDVCQSRDGFA